MLPSATCGRSISPQHHHTPTKEEFTQRRENILLSEIFPEKYIDFIDEEIFVKSTKPQTETGAKPTVSRKESYHKKMPKKRKSKILDDDEFREAYGFVRKNSMTHSQTKILTRQKKVDMPIEYPSDSTSLTSGDLLEHSHSNPNLPEIDHWSHRSSSGLGSEAEECYDADTTHVTINNELYDLPLKTLIKINRRTSKYKPIQIKIAAQSHQNVEQSGYLHHKIARRIYSIVWAVCSDNVLYLYQSINDSITMDVICLQSYRPRANLNRAPKDKFKFKLEQRDCETHHFYVETFEDCTKWFATFEQCYQRKTLCEGEEEEAESISSSLTPRSSMDTSLSLQDSIGGLQPRIQNILDISKETDTIGLGLSPSRDKQEKTKISEHYRKMQEVIASESHQKMTRLTQRRHSTCQKMNRLARTNSGPADTRKNGLQLQLTEINEEIHKTVIQSKENLGRIAAAREKELRSLSSGEVGSIELDSDEDYHTMALSLDQATFQREKKGSKKSSKKINRLSGLLERIPKRIRERSVKRSLSRSKSAAMTNEKKSVTSLLSISSYDHPSQQSFDHFSQQHAFSQQASSEDGVELPTSYVVPIIPVLPSTSTKMTDEEKSRNRKTNLSRLKDKGILDELEAFEKLCNEFNDKCSHKQSTNGNGSTDEILLQAVDNGQHGQRITMTENLI